MKKLKELVEKKEVSKSDRTRAAIILGLYLIFFIFIISALNNGNSTPSNNNENITNYTNISENYNYTYNIEIKNNEKTNKYLFTGIVNNNQQTMKMQLYNEETKKYETINEYEDVNPKFHDLNTIISYVNNLKEEFSTNYKDGTIQRNYLVELNKIDDDIDSTETIEINVFEKDNFITKIIIDGSNFDSKTNNKVTNSKYILEYTEINSKE